MSLRTAAIFCSLLLLFASAPAQQPEIDPVFRPILGELRQKVQIPIRLPAKLPDLGQRLAFQGWVDLILAGIPRSRPSF